MLTNFIGGADGFGFAVVDRFSSEACHVILVDLNKEKGERKAQSDAKLYFVEGGVTLSETWDKALSYARDTFGRLDLVVNNAGV